MKAARAVTVARAALVVDTSRVNSAPSVVALERSTDWREANLGLAAGGPKGCGTRGQRSAASTPATALTSDATASAWRLGRPVALKTGRAAAVAATLGADLISSL
jgi:hypothetical protein